MKEHKKIIESYLNGNRYAVDLIIDEYKSPLYRLCIKLTKDNVDADDLFQDTWMKIFKNLNKYNPSKSFENWIYTICINLYRDRYNKKKRWLNIIKDYFSNESKKNDFRKISDDSNPLDNVVENEESTKIKDSLNKLNNKYRIPLILYYFKDISYKEISEILCIPIGTVKSRIHTGKEKLKDILREDCYER